jgi:hypothetical protein
MQIPSVGNQIHYLRDFGGESFLLSWGMLPNHFYKYQFEFSSRGMIFLSLLVEKTCIFAAPLSFLQGCNCIDGNNEDWCHF